MQGNFVCQGVVMKKMRIWMGSFYPKTLFQKIRVRICIM